MGIFDDLFDVASDAVSVVTEPLSDVAEAVGFDRDTWVVDIAATAVLLGIEIAVVKAALASGCGTVGEVKDWSDKFGGGGTFGGGGGSI